MLTLVTIYRMHCWSVVAVIALLFVHAALIRAQRCVIAGSDGVDY